MDESFRNKVAPVILNVLDVLDQIEFAPQAVPTPERIRMRFKDLIGQFDVRGVGAEQFRLAKRALVYWTDELLIYSSWEHARAWRNNPLELELYGTRNRAWLFFKDASTARGLEQTDALEVFALCVTNGFQGVYRTGGIPIGAMQGNLVTAGSAASTEPAEKSNRGETADDAPAGHWSSEKGDHEAIAFVASLPATLDEWLSSAFVQVLGEPLPAFQPSAPFDSSRYVRPLVGRQSSIRWGLVLVGVVIFTTILITIGGW